jgi:RHH-type proline utilization regulon transcriptional repressor/proline dehydrogenase/delta 1-pyrroline-5-carboxylate dehydrogenase
MRLPFPYRPEAEAVAEALASLHGALDWAAAARQAAPWVQAVRDKPPPFWAVDSLLKEYPISSAEGLALMRLAEALLRVPDAETAIALTADQLGRADFDGAADSSAMATSPSAMARLSSAAIAMSKKFLPPSAGPGQAADQPGLMAKLGAKTVVAATLRAVQLLGRQFVLGQTIEAGMSEADAARRKQPNLSYSYDMLGEGARTDADALQYLASYQNAIRKIAEKVHPTLVIERNDGISIKLSALHPRYEAAQQARVLRELVPRVWSLCELAARANISLTIDAEEVDRLELSLDVFEALAAQVAQHFPQWSGFGLALQSYQTRALPLVEHVIALARKYRLRFMCRLVKGAYWDAEIKRAQELGLPHYPVFTHKHHTDVSYLACARALLAAPDAIYPQFATHNAGTIAAILQMAARPAGVDPSQSLGGSASCSVSPARVAGSSLTCAEPTATQTQGPRFELQRLHGMSEGTYREVLKNPLVNCRVYAPVGAHRDLLAYLVRRLLENGANSSFVHQLADESVGMDQLLISPLQLSLQSISGLESNPSLPLPLDLYGPARRNSAGLDLAVATMLAPLLQALQTVQVPVIQEFDVKLASSQRQKAQVCYQQWSEVPVAERAAALRRTADALEQQLPRFCALLVKEAFKTWGDAVAEVREAVDFLRYYANEAERIMAPVVLPGPTGESNELRLTARGVWVCISPWNFPLAIFMGQVAAALATGNTVLAKPAEQTPGVAWEAVKLLHAAGVPADAVQLMHGPGETVGAALVALPGIAGVVFTGSTQVARIINRALAAKDGPIVPLIAETGGINAMVVDSTALPEQVADAVVQSAFRSALRLLCLHEGIADAVIEMIQGAARELVVGDTADLATDVGPVIDREAFEGIQKHLQRLNSESKRLLPSAEWPQGAMNLIPPTAFEVPSIASVQNEIFGPVLHIVRWNGDPLAVIRQINALGYGLTLGIQTRIDSRAQAMAHAAHVGNVYINRNMIGAVVGVQPFGGEGLSGTGPKAGGPHYLYRFCAEQTVTVNTTAAGGNVQLLA